MNPCVGRRQSEIESETKLRAMRDLFDGKSIDNIDGKNMKVDSALVRYFIWRQNVQRDCLESYI